MNSSAKISEKEILHNSVNPVSKPEYDLAGQVIGLAMKVHRTLGPGFSNQFIKKLCFTSWSKLVSKLNPTNQSKFATKVSSSVTSKPI